MLQSYCIDGEKLDTLDLKAMLIRQGVWVKPEVYEASKGKHRLSPDPMECNTIILPGGSAVHLVDLGMAAPFQLKFDSRGNLELRHRGEFVTEVSLPRPSSFYTQQTSRGTAFRGMAVLEGSDVLAFPYLWPCKYPEANATCKFCHCAYGTEAQLKAGQKPATLYTPQDVADAVKYAVNVEKSARNIEITGGSTFKREAEIDQALAMLKAIDASVGLANIPGDVTVLTTPPTNPKLVDSLFEAGLDFLACDIEVWDQERADEIIPGKQRFVGLQRTFDTLTHVAHTHGKFKAVSGFVVGLEPAGSFLAAASHLAANGIIPIPSIFLPHGLGPIAGDVQADTAFFRRIKHGIAKIYDQYECEPPGEMGSNVSACRDIWNHRAEILSASGPLSQ